MDFKDDIVAISSPGGMGAISLIRVSGEKALEKVPPSVDKDIEKTYESMRDTLSSARARQMEEEKPAYMG